MTFDRTEEYEKYIAPQLVGLKKLCVKYHVPFFFAVCIANNDKESVYKKVDGAQTVYYGGEVVEI